MKIWFHVTSGNGPEECCLAVLKICDLILKEAKLFNIYAQIIESSEKKGESILLSLEGEDLMTFKKRFEGTHLWVCKSPYRIHHKRKNWYIEIDVLSCDEKAATQLDIKDIVFQTMKNSGPGGQHVNTTDSAVRAIHQPTGLCGKASEERSQHMNKKLAIARLQKLLEEQQQNKIKKIENDIWQNNQNLERGNPVRTFYGIEFKEKL